MSLPAILFEPDGYVLDGPKLMGRQSAGNGFLRALVKAAEARSTVGNPESLLAWTPNRKSADVFKRLLNEMSPDLVPGWIPTDRLDLLAQRGALFLPGPGLAQVAKQRLRVGPAAWSLTGATYTLCSHRVMDDLVAILEAPVMPWDALICATTVAKSAVETLWQLQAEYLTWRFGVQKFLVPQLPIIPFGVHTADFEFDGMQRASARQQMYLSEDEVAILFAGRLSFHAKAHPFQMLESLQTVSERTKKKLVLVLCGQFPNEAVGMAFKEATQQHAPNVRLICVDGKDFDAYNRAWAASDIFVSLSDNLQETFGITPVEAMASGLPVIVSDWDGYKDTIIDGETGFRIPTWMPPPDVGMALAAAFEAGTINYDRYIGLACLDVSVDQRSLVNCLEQLVQDPAFRARLGAAGKIRAKQVYEWSVVMGQHETLWLELDDLRTKTISQNLPQLNSAPKCAPARQDPYRVFGSFTTSFIKGDTVVAATKKKFTGDNWDALLRESMFSFAGSYISDRASVDKIMEVLYEQNQQNPEFGVKVSDLANRVSFSLAKTIKIVALISKMNFVELKNGL